MYALLDDASRRAYSAAEFRRAYRDAAATATVRRVDAGEPGGEQGAPVTVPIVLHTRVFGRVRGELRLPVNGERVTWGPLLAFPGLRPRRGTEPPQRAGPARHAAVTRRQGARARPGRQPELPARGDRRLDRRDARARGDRGGAPRALRAAVPARLAGRAERARGGVREPAGRPPRRRAARRAARVLARARPRRSPAGAHDDRQPAPGGGRDRAGGTVRRHRGARPAQRRDPRAGRDRLLGPAAAGLDLQDHDHRGGARGGRGEAVDRVPGRQTPRRSTASSWRTRTASTAAAPSATASPTRATRCSRRSAWRSARAALVDAAERFGWNGDPTVPGEVPSTLPPAAEITTPLEVGSTAIGQFRTLATPLQMASVAQTIAARGVRRLPTLSLGRRHPQRARGHSARIARTIESLMLDVVAYGTGTAAALPGVKVAGKTGTAELEDTRDPETGETEALGPVEHRRLVRRLRARGPPEDRGGGDAGAGGRGRSDGGAGGAGGAGRGAVGQAPASRAHAAQSERPRGSPGSAARAGPEPPS